MLEDHKLVIKEKEITEKVLYQHATELLDTLTKTVDDVDNLHNKIGFFFSCYVLYIINILERKKTVEDENKRKLEKFSRYIQNRINITQEELHHFQNDQKKLYSNLEEMIITFIETQQLVCNIDK